MIANSVVTRTGQRWKLVLAGAALLIGSIVPAFPGSGLSWTAGTIIAVAGYLAGCWLIRCPECNTRWFWTALMRADWYRSLLTEPACPSCAHEFGAAEPN